MSAEKPSSLSDTKDEIALSSGDVGSSKETYVQNVFLAKKIDINKYWLDNDNEDGLRPDSLVVTIYEKVPASGETPETVIPFERTLYAAEQTGDTNSGHWTMKAALARYYFNGAEAFDNLNYKIDELTVPTGYSKVTIASSATQKYGKGTYHDESGTMVEDCYTVSGNDYDGSATPVTYPISNIEYRALGDSTTGISKLNLTNHKEPQKGELTLTKAFADSDNDGTPDDDAFKADTRPDNLYFMLTDKTDGTYLTKSDYDRLHLTLRQHRTTCATVKNMI